MSLLENLNNDFEKKLRRQIGNSEVKPSEGLWDKINQEVNRPDFELKVAEKLYHFEVNPTAETWFEIEKELPPTQKRKKIYPYLYTSLLFTILAVAGISVYKHYPPSNNALTLNEQASLQPQHKVKESFTTKKSTITQQKNLDKHQPQNNPYAVYSTNNKAVNAEKKVHAILRKKDNALTQKNIQPQSKTKLNKNNSTPTNIAASGIQVDSVTQPVSFSGNTASSNVNSNNPENTFTSQQTINVALAVEQDSTNSNPTNALIKQPESVATLQIQPDTNKTTALTEQHFTDDSNGELSKFSIGIVLGVHLNNMLYTQVPPSLQANVDLRKTVEQPQTAIQLGFTANYHLKPNLILSSGILITQFKMGMFYNTSPAVTSPAKETGATLINATDSITSGQVYNQSINYSWNEVPLLVTFQTSESKKLRFELTTGISIGFINNVDASMVNTNNVGVIVLKGDEYQPSISHSLFLQGAAGISYAIKPDLAILLQPYAKYSLNNMIKNEVFPAQHPLLIGIGTGLRKRF